jgi:hypothetical protein
MICCLGYMPSDTPASRATQGERWEVKLFVVSNAAGVYRTINGAQTRMEQ